MQSSFAIDLTKKLIQIESTNPGSYEREIEQWIYNWLSNLPKESGVKLYEEEVLPNRFNLMAELPGTDKDAPALIFICHMDTVVVGSGWTLSPFEAEEKDGRIYGRGSCDMKSGLACCLSAFATIAKETAKTGQPLTRSLKIICTMDEEDFMRGSEQCIRSGWVTKDDWILDSEPTNGQIQVAHKGRTWYEIEVKGHTAHASTPWKGADAIAAMAEIIRSIRLTIANAPTHPDLGNSTVTFGQIVGGYRPYVVPDSCKMWVDMRLVPPLDSERTKKIVEEAIKTAKKEIEGIFPSYKITGDRPYIEKDENSPLLKALCHASQKVTQEKTIVSFFPGYTDTAVIAGTLQNHNCMSYGPGNLECAHQPDEWVSIDDIIRCEKVYKELAQCCFA